MSKEINVALDRCVEVIEHIRENINNTNGGCRFCSEIPCSKLKKLHKSLSDVCNLISDTHPVEAEIIKTKISGLIGVDRINPYDFGGIIVVIKILQSKYNIIDGKKVFISHSSGDEKIVKSFVTQILRLGCGLQPKDIICTSLESTGVKTGEDIRNYLKINLKNCEYMFFMISDNYQKSGICLNEMGAAWVLDKKVKPFLFPNLNFTDLGWLYEISKGSTLDNESALDHLRDELLEVYDIIENPQTADWNIQKKEFLTQLKG